MLIAPATRAKARTSVARWSRKLALRKLLITVILTIVNRAEVCTEAYNVGNTIID